MEAGTRKITDILSRSTILQIPHFQRSYVWGQEQWGRFIDDMKYASRQNRPYFMGSIILKQQETPTKYQTRDVRTIIDGQQRVTTFMLFYKALFIINEKPEVFTTTFKTFHDELILEHNYFDKPVFDKILLDQVEALTDEEKETQIYKCFKYFLKVLKKNEINQNNLLGNILFVGIDLHSKEDEQQIFDTINSLGVSLTTAELLKNYLFKDDIVFYNNNWRDVFEKNYEIRKYWDQEVTSGRNIRNNIDLFLQAYLFIKIQERKINVSSDDKERFFKIDSVFNSYKEFITGYEIDKNLIINEIKEYATVYKNTINPKIIAHDIDKDDYTQRLNLVMFGLDTATIIPYVLYVTKKVNDLDEKNKIFRYLEAYLLRRLICKETTKNYNQLFRSLINNNIDSLEKLKEIIEMKGEKINKMPTDNAVEEGMNTSKLANKYAKGVLYLLERTTRNDLNATELKYFNEYSLEHVMPKKWHNNWNNENMTKEQEEKRDNLLLTLGNLTLITKQLNSSLRDSNWEIKKSGNGRNLGLIEYAQGIEIFSQYLQRDSWDENSIKERVTQLFTLAVKKVWNLNF